jgi:hypothetical protein
LVSKLMGRLDPIPVMHVLVACERSDAKAKAIVSVDPSIGFDCEKSYPVAEKTTQVDDVTKDLPRMTADGRTAMPSRSSLVMASPPAVTCESTILLSRALCAKLLTAKEIAKVNRMTRMVIAEAIITSANVTPAERSFMVIHLPE